MLLNSQLTMEYIYVGYEISICIAISFQNSFIYLREFKKSLKTVNINCPVLHEMSLSMY